jgi:hypothetical protein
MWCFCTSRILSGPAVATTGETIHATCISDCVGAKHKLTSLHSMCRHCTNHGICSEKVLQCDQQRNCSGKPEVGTTGKFEVGANNQHPDRQWQRFQ